MKNSKKGFMAAEAACVLASAATSAAIFYVDKIFGTLAIAMVAVLTYAVTHKR